MQIALVFILLFAAILLFVTEKVPIDVTTLLLVITLMLTGILTLEEAFLGFSSDFMIILASIFVISGALRETGVLDQLGLFLIKFSNARPRLLMLFIMILAGSVSAFINNTTVTALFLPPVLEIANRLKFSASKLLIPLAFGSILGGTCTLIGTSTNVAASGYINTAGLEPIRMFELLPIGLILFAAGVLYMFVAGYDLLPSNPNKVFTEAYKLRKYVSELIILEGSPLIGKTLATIDLEKLKFRVLKVLRDEKVIFPQSKRKNRPFNFFGYLKRLYSPHPTGQVRFRQDDRLVVEGQVENLLKIKETEGLEIRADTIDEEKSTSPKLQLAEVIIPPGSKFKGSKVRHVPFKHKMGLVVIAVNHHGQLIPEKISDVEMQLGDILLVQGEPEAIEELKGSRDLSLIQQFQPVHYKKRKGIIVLTLFAAAIAVGSLQMIPLAIALLTAAVGAVVVQALSPEKVYEYMDWRLLILIGGMTAFGVAMEKTGAADVLAIFVKDHLSAAGPIVIMGAFIVLTIILTQPMSNAAAALVILPVAIKTATELGFDPRSFAIAVMIAASVSVIAPFEPSCLIVYGPGRYRFADFFKTGFFLTVISIALMLLLIPIFWPLSG